MSAANQPADGVTPIFITRQHSIVLFLPALWNLLAICLFTALSLYLKRYWFLVFYLVPIMGFFLELLSWYKRRYMVTESRVIRQEGLLASSRLEVPLDNIQQVIHRPGLLGRLFQYGKILIDASDIQNPVTFHFLAQPEAYKSAIIRMQEARRYKPKPVS